MLDQKDADPDKYAPLRDVGKTDKRSESGAECKQG